MTNYAWICDFIVSTFDFRSLSRVYSFLFSHREFL
uniref:Uncharacterized protein n=1 Tax=Schistosoma mansoni TaxID=6183 RepID=A0A5K4F5W1_SCHMA